MDSRLVPFHFIMSHLTCHIPPLSSTGVCFPFRKLFFSVVPFGMFGDVDGLAPNYATRYYLDKQRDTFSKNNGTPIMGFTFSSGDANQLLL